MSADGRVVIHLLTLKCGPPLDKESSREEIKLVERMASILKDFEARQHEVDEDEQLEVVEEGRKIGIRKMNRWTWRGKQAVGI
ncbi:unnamed protein product [Heligmosomoides polygyrus]|uniref:Uncharacterized protein n=1 Tax=Heligmosomoides polygyrus TaxID=6339 RepID=A0A183GWE1_HELPZ|nr:unnamed protein product [Heligmosomoides polygyrus]